MSLKEPLGPITTAEYGVVVEVYSEDKTPDGMVVGSKDFDMFGALSLFDYGVVFPRLRGWVSDHSDGPWLTDEVDLSQFKTGVGQFALHVDVVPFGHDELNYIDSQLRGVMG